MEWSRAISWCLCWSCVSAWSTAQRETFPRGRPQHQHVDLLVACRPLALRGRCHHCQHQLLVTTTLLLLTFITHMQSTTSFKTSSATSCHQSMIENQEKLKLFIAEGTFYSNSKTQSSSSPPWWYKEHFWSFTVKQSCSILLNNWSSWRLDLKQRNNQRNIRCLHTAHLLWSQSAGENTSQPDLRPDLH